MADSKLTALTETTSPATSDDVYVVTTPGGTPASKRCTIANLKTSMGVVSRSGATTDGHVAVWNGSSADSIKDGGLAPAMVLLGASTLGGDAAAISVASIPSGYSAIKVIAWLRATTVADSIWCNGLINDDSGANYDLVQIAAIGTSITATTQNGASSFSVGTIPAASATAGMFAQVEMTIAQYAGAHRKVIRVDSIATYDVTSDTIFNLNSCAWRSTSAITKVSFVTAANFLAASTMSVYGLT